MLKPGYAKRCYATATPFSLTPKSNLKTREIFRNSLPDNRYRSQHLQQPLLSQHPPNKEIVGYTIHGKFTSNNTLLTLTRKYRLKDTSNMSSQQKLMQYIRPHEEPLINMTTGKVGFKGTKKGEYEAAFQATVKLINEMVEKNYTDRPIEVVLSEFGQGREAVLNILNGREGVKIRPALISISDNTPIRFGGCRPPNKRRR